jgi:hypothetical protein
MISLEVIIWIIFAHWFSDFVCQTDYWARNKSKYNAVLFQHVLLYSVLMGLAVSFVTIGLYIPFVFFLVTFVCHFATDWVTSRITSKLAAKEDWHNFFVVIGLDQMLHYIQLFITFYLLTAK